MSADSLSTIGRGVLAGAKMPYQPSIAKSGKPASSMVGRSGAEGERVAQVWRQRLDLAGARLRQRRRQIVEHEGDATAHQVGHGRRTAAIGHVRGLDAGALDQKLGGDCWELPVAAEA